MRSLVCRLALVAAAVTALLVPAVASAQTPLELGVKYLEVKEKAEKNTEPAFGGDWALTSLASAGKAAAEVTRGKTKPTNARAWYEGYIDPATWPEESEYKAGEFEKAALISYAAGIEPARVSVERNLIANVISEYQTANPGYYGKPSVFEDTIFGLLALADTKTIAGVERIPVALLKQSVEAIVKNQHTDGGWSYEQAEGSKEVLESVAEADTTGAAIAALCTSGVKYEGEEKALSKGEEFLKKILELSGGFEYIYGKPNADSNAWAVQGLKACGVSIETFKKEGKEAKTPIEFLESLQIKTAGEEEGGFLEEKGSAAGANYYASQDAVRALAKGGFTAEPPAPKNKELKQWEYKTEFSTTKSSQLALIVNNGSSLKVCSVTVKAGSKEEEPSIGLLKILEKAKAGGSEVKPSGCVSSFEPTSGSGAITHINGTAASWKASLNGGGEKTAELGTKVELGAVIYLNA
jgi:hypothetical protein